MHGCGNDYIYVNAMQEKIEHPEAAAIQWSDRHKGIGSDGLVLIDRSPVAEADFSMRIFNADGSEAMMCGNASRCIGKYLYERGLTDKRSIRLHTLSGIKVLELHVGTDDKVESVTVDMGEPRLEDERLYRAAKAPLCPVDISPKGGEGSSQFIVHSSQLGTCNQNSSIFNFPSLPFGGGQGRGAGAVFVSMGNPHYVIFTDDIDQVGTTGPVMERHTMFPQRCNIEFASKVSEGSFRVRVWERGSGITQACGTGACATAVAATVTGRTGRTAEIIMDGGTLHIEWKEEDNHVYMTGPATFVFDGEI